MDLTQFKKGDKIIVTNFNNSQPRKFLNTIVEIKTKGTSSNYYTIWDPTGKITGTCSLYWSGPADEFIPADREARIKYQTDRVKQLEKELKAEQKELEFLEKYEDGEEYLAEKLESLFQANDAKSRAEILRELRRTDFL